MSILVISYFEYLNKQKQKPEVILIFTDGGFCDEKYTLKKTLQRKVLWVLTGNYDTDIKQLGFGKIVSC